VLTALLLCSSALTAQTPILPDAQDPPPGLYTLHVYANLAQVPTLIISPDERPFSPIPANQFFVSLDGGPQFHPTKVRIEGDDAITLAIIVDESGGQTHFNTNIADTLAKMVPKDLHPQDHVSIYAIDCKAIQSVDDAPVSSELIRKGVNNALSAPTLHGEKHKPACGGSVHLWDLLALVSTKLGHSRSRRAVLVVSLGMDGGSTTTLDQAIYTAQSNSVAIFGLRDFQEYAFQRSFRDISSSQDKKGNMDSGHVADGLDRLATLSGGLVYNRLHIQIEETLHRFVSDLRKRYIVEFPRPDGGQAGIHQIAITIPSKWDYMVRFTGASMPLSDPTVLKDPNTIPTAPSPATFGNQRPPQPKH